MVCEFDLDRAVVDQFRRSGAADLIHLVASDPDEEDHRSAIFEIEAGLHGPEGDLAMTIGPNGHRGGLDQVEVVALPEVSLDDPPPANELAVARPGHGDAPA